MPPTLLMFVLRSVEYPGTAITWATPSVSWAILLSWVTRRSVRSRLAPSGSCTLTTR